MRFGSVCSGIEAASVAWHPLGWQAAWLAEIEPFPCAVLAYHYPTVPNLGDMTTITRRVLTGEVEAPDVFTGGTPCQAFSVAGLRRSLDDARGNLSLTFCEIADAIDHVRVARGDEPAVIVWENVPGVLSTADNAFGCFLAGLAGEDDPLLPPGGKWANAGAVYGPTRAVAWRTLDAQYFGLAQRRRRVFVVASAREGFDPAAVLFEWDRVRRDSAPSREPREGAAACAAAGAGVRRWPADVASTLNAAFGDKQGLEDQHALSGAPLFVPAPAIAWAQELADPLAAHEQKTYTHEGTGNFRTRNVQAVAIRTAQTGSNGWGINTEGTAYTLDSAQQAVAVSFAIQAGALRTNPNSGPDGVGVQADHAYTLEARAEVQAVAVTGDVFHTLRAEGFDASEDGTGRGAVAVSVGMAVRRLTPRECERLQGFPDDYTAIPWRGKPADQCPDGPRYKALGNSWAVPCARWIGERIADCLPAAVVRRAA